MTKTAQRLVERLRAVTGFIRFETNDRVLAASCLSEEAAECIESLSTQLTTALALGRDVAHHKNLAELLMDTNASLKDELEAVKRAYNDLDLCQMGAAPCEWSLRKETF
jgi:hypothetical protein